MSDRPWYKRYGGDFVLGTMSLSLEEKGAYSLCLDLIYDRGGPIPDDARWLAGVCGVSVRKWNAIRDRLLEAGKLVAEGGHLSNERADKELENAAKTSRKLAENGAKGGNKSAETRLGFSKNSSLGQAGLKPNQKPEPELEEDAHASSERARDVEDGFEEAWSAYPHEAGWSSRPKALAAWMTIPDELKPQLAAAATRYCREGRRPPSGHPAFQRWLDEERWRYWLGGSAEVAPLQAFRGPAEVRQAFVEECGEDWTRSYLDPCGWQDVPERALVPATSYAANKIIRVASVVLQELNLTIVARSAA